MKRETLIPLSPSKDLVNSHLSEIRLALLNADPDSLSDIKRIVDITAVLGNAAERAHLCIETVNQVQLIRLDAEIKLGHAIRRAKEAGQLHVGQPEKRIVVANDNSFNLNDYGISRDLSSRAQTLAEHETEARAKMPNITEKLREFSVLKLFADIRRNAVRAKLQSNLEQ